MSVQRKCLAASAITHGLLVVLLLVSSAFIPQKPRVEGPSFELITIPDMLVDEPNRVGGGNPNAGSAAPPPLVEPKTPEPAPAQPVKQPEAVKLPEPVKQPEKLPEPVKEPEPARPARVEQKAPEPVKPKIDPNSFKISEKAKPQPKETRPAITFNDILKNAKEMKIAANNSGADSKARERAAAEQDRIAQARAGAVASAMQRVQGGLSSVGGEIGIPGPGGAAYASYHLAIRKIYEDAWIPPTASRANEPVVEAEVVIRKDGTVLRKRIVKRTGRSQLDRSVQEVLNRVKKVPPFPTGATDQERTFRINFNLTDKLAL